MGASPRGSGSAPIWAVVYHQGRPRGWCGLEGGTWHVGVVSAPRDSPPRLSARKRVARSMCGNAVLWLRAGRLTTGRHREIALSILATPSLGADAWVLRLERGRLRALAHFHADRVRAADRTGDGRAEIVLSWLYAGRSPDGRTVEQVWRFERGAYRLWRRR